MKLPDHERATLPISTRDHRQAVPLVRPRVRLLPRIPRRLDLVDPELLAILRRLVEGHERWPLFLHGPPGTGKTCAALALCDISETAAYTTPEELCNRVMDASTANSELWEWVGSKHLAILDELGSRARVTDLPYMAVKDFADARERAGNPATIFISNLQPTGILKLYDDRVASRLLSGTIHHLIASDRRFDQ